MLQLNKISKQYRTGDLVQQALDQVSLSLRDNEFVSILGPSGSGKTTLLNVIGGLDRYDSGDLVINGVSTKQYRDRDWDSYRNHTIGFVFQSYNLIPHQSVLANVELALTISGVSRGERRQRAKQALEEVGLGNQLHKRPSQMSGGQMQRVAIARALVNDPDILLADEPTGALDSETSIQIMELLKRVAKDRLVVMVTHNPELAQRYSTRIVKLRDGKIIDDSDPYTPAPAEKPLEHRNLGKAKMSFGTSLALSFNNLRTKKGRTVLTAFAGSIGIIGIALILAFSHGVNGYITDIQRETMTSYPVTITAEAVDMSSIMGTMGSLQAGEAEGSAEERDGVWADHSLLESSEALNASIKENNLTSFEEYLDDPNSEIQQYLGENGVVYTYDVRFSVYSRDEDGALVPSDADPEEAVSDCIAAYNAGRDEEDQITYTDYVALLTGSITSIVDMISYVLIAFVGVSLIVSSIMIGIITHISVLERTKEIGILRAIGASKGNIAQVFNAETLIIGLLAGTIGVGVSALLTLPINSLIRQLLGAETLTTSLPLGAALILVALSMAITLIAGLVPARSAAKKDPVAALRSE